MPQILSPILPTAPEVSIVTSARRIPANELSDAFAGGISFTDSFCLGVYGWPRCPDEPTLDAGKEAPDAPECPEFLPWTIYVPVVLERNSPDAIAETFNAARKALPAKLPSAVGTELWTGAISGSESLQSAAVDVSATSAMGAAQAASVLVGNFRDATGGSQAWLHVPEAVMYQLYRDNYVVRRGDQLVTPTGDIVVPGPGYPSYEGAWGPAGSPGPGEATADEVFMYVTGPVELGFGEVTDDMTSGLVSAGTFARLNRSTLYVEQDAIFRFPPCAVFSALVAKAA